MVLAPEIHGFLGFLDPASIGSAPPVLDVIHGGARGLLGAVEAQRVRAPDVGSHGPTSNKCIATSNKKLLVTLESPGCEMTNHESLLSTIVHSPRSQPLSLCEHQQLFDPAGTEMMLIR